MRETYTVTREVKVQVTIYKCDFPGCTYSSATNTGCCGVADLMQCEFCGIDICRSHSHIFWDGDYTAGISCVHPECIEKLNDKEEHYHDNDEDDSE